MTDLITESLLPLTHLEYRASDKQINSAEEDVVSLITRRMMATFNQTAMETRSDVCLLIQETGISVGVLRDKKL